MGNGVGAAFSRAAPIPETGGASSIQAGDKHFCINGAGYMACWGYGQWGQLATGSTADETSQVIYTGLSGINQVFTGYGATCAQSASQDIICWGYGEYARFGNGIYYSGEYLEVMGLDESLP